MRYRTVFNTTDQFFHSSHRGFAIDPYSWGTVDSTDERVVAALRSSKLIIKEDPVTDEDVDARAVAAFRRTAELNDDVAGKSPDSTPEGQE